MRDEQAPLTGAEKPIPSVFESDSVERAERQLHLELQNKNVQLTNAALCTFERVESVSTEGAKDTALYEYM